MPNWLAGKQKVEQILYSVNLGMNLFIKPKSRTRMRQQFIYSSAASLISLLVEAQTLIDSENTDSEDQLVWMTNTADSIESKEDAYVIQINSKEYIENHLEPRYMSGLLNASMDVFTRTITYDFGSVFYRNRSLDSQQRTVLLNNVSMNKFYDGRADWNNWGGLNDALRNQEIYLNLSPSPFVMGKLDGIVNINSQASFYSEGLKVSFAASNRTYRSRLMATYGSSWIKEKWKYSFSVSARNSDQGFKEGSRYEAYSFLASIDRKIGGRHHLNGTLIYAFNNRGVAAPMTREVFELKGNRYNAYWGFQGGRIRNSRMRKTFEPILQLNYSLSTDNNFKLKASLTCQYGSKSSSRLDYGGSRLTEAGGSIVGGGLNPDPTYYQKLPSYFIKEQNNPDYIGAYLAREDFIQNGQLNWTELYEANLLVSKHGNSVYALYEDKRDDLLISIKVDGQKLLSPGLWLRGSAEARFLHSDNYAELQDLLGGNGYLDVDSFDAEVSESQSDLRFSNRIVTEKDRFKYNFHLDSKEISGFLRADYWFGKQEYYLATDFGVRTYLRNGLFENGSYPGSASFGKGKLLSFGSVGLKMGLLHKFSGRHLLNFQAAFLQRPPSIKDSFSNIRENKDPVKDLKPSNHRALDLTYHMRLPKIQGKMSLYWMESRNGTKVSFYYADGLTGLDNSGTSAFIHEVRRGMSQGSSGIEGGLSYKVTNTVMIKGVAAYGWASYLEDPSIYITSDDLKEPVDYGNAALKGYRIPNGPQRAFSLGFEYSDPDYWWFGVSYNWFDHSYLQIAPVTRTRNFFQDSDGLIINAYNGQVAEELLKQEKLPPFAILNLVGGKSWKINQVYVGFFASINNALNHELITGGFEQSRNANYLTLLEDKSRKEPLFSPKYWYGYGATFYFSFYIRIT